MKKSMVALAALMVCGASAFAQTSSVTLFGGVDGNVTLMNTGGKGTEWQMRDGGMYVSKIGFTGSEDLGGGYRAHFYLESQSNSDTGTAATTNTNNAWAAPSAPAGLTFNRKATVSLFSPYGEVRMGRDYTTTFIPTTVFDPFFSAGVAAAVNFQPYHTSTLALPTLVRVSNSAAYYIPPSWVPGLSAWVQGAPSEGGSRFLGLGSLYIKGPLMASVGVGKTKAPFAGSAGVVGAATASTSNNLSVWSAGASYNFSGFKVMGFYQSQTLDTLLAERDHTVNDLLVGFSWAIDKSTIKASFMKRDDRGVSNNDPKQIGLGYSYNFSRRTAVYANYVNVINSATGTYNFLAAGTLPTAGQSASAMQVGISHNF